MTQVVHKTFISHLIQSNDYDLLLRTVNSDMDYYIKNIHKEDNINLIGFMDIFEVITTQMYFQENFDTDIRNKLTQKLTPNGSKLSLKSNFVVCK